MNWKLTAILCLLLFVGCKNVSTEREELAKAELLLENAPDSALLILDDIRTRSGLPDDIKASSILLTAKAKLRKGESFLTSGRTRGDMDVVKLKPSWQVNFGASKSMKNWFFQLQATDIFKTARSSMITYGTPSYTDPKGSKHRPGALSRVCP